jgi:hypothetical protein
VLQSKRHIALVDADAGLLQVQLCNKKMDITFQTQRTIDYREFELQRGLSGSVSRTWPENNDTVCILMDFIYSTSEFALDFI